MPLRVASPWKLPQPFCSVNVWCYKLLSREINECNGTDQLTKFRLRKKDWLLRTPRSPNNQENWLSNRAFEACNKISGLGTKHHFSKRSPYRTLQAENLWTQILVRFWVPVISKKPRNSIKDVQTRRMFFEAQTSRRQAKAATARTDEQNLGLSTSPNHKIPIHPRQALTTRVSGCWSLGPGCLTARKSVTTSLISQSIKFERLQGT